MAEISSRMKPKKKYALNKLFNIFMVLGVFLGLISWLLLREGEQIGIGIGMMVGAFLFVFIPPFFTPYCYAFDPEGVSFLYVFVPNERYLWKDIRAIEADCYSFETYDLWDFFFSEVFRLKGKNIGQKRFYMNGNMRKSFRTKRLLGQYWDGEIEGLFWQEAKEWMSKRRGKKQGLKREYATDEIAPMEQAVREKAEKWVVPFQQKAKEFGLALAIRYLYINDAFDELTSRPGERYVYTLLATISLPGETDESRMVEFSVDLVFVCIGKGAYRGVENEMAQEELNELGAVLDEIHKEGIDIYCETLS